MMTADEIRAMMPKDPGVEFLEKTVEQLMAAIFNVAAGAGHCMRWRFDDSAMYAGEVLAREVAAIFVKNGFSVENKGQIIEVSW